MSDQDPAPDPDRGRNPAAADAAANPSEEAEQARERHATNLELFLDLAFVFAVAQIAALIASNLTVVGAAKGMIIAWLVWWLWGQFAWLGTSIDLDVDVRARVMVLAAIPPTLLLGIAIPTAYSTSGLLFGAAYLFVQMWALAIQGLGLWGEKETRLAWLSYAPAAAVSPVLVLVGGVATGQARVALWVAAGVVNLVAALLGGRQRDDRPSDWHIDPTHFAERHALFVIIVLGEVLVAVGVAASAVELKATVGVGIVAAVLVACAFWWGYFGFVSSAMEMTLQRAKASDRARLARDLFTFGHFPIVSGVAFYAVVAKHLVVHPTDRLSGTDLVVLALSVTLFVGGLAGLQWRAVRQVSPERPAAIAIVVVLCASAGPFLPGAVLVAAVAAVIAAMSVVTQRRFRRSMFALSGEPG